MPLVMEAVEKFGIQDAFRDYWFCSLLPQTTESLKWILHSESRDTFPRWLRRDVLLNAPSELLHQFLQDLENPNVLTENGRQHLSRHVALLAMPVTEVWEELQNAILQPPDKSDGDRAGNGDDEQEPKNELDESEYDDPTETAPLQLVDPPEKDQVAFENLLAADDYQIFLALCVHPQSPDDLILAELSKKPPDTFVDLDDWKSIVSMQSYAIDLAGDRKITAAVPRLFELLQHFDASESETANSWRLKCIDALANIGTSEVHQQIGARFRSMSSEGRRSSIWILERNHTEESMQILLDLLQQESRLSTRQALLRAALNCFESKAIPFARIFLLQHELTLDRLLLREALLECCDMCGERVPEYDEWKRNSRRDVAKLDSQNRDAEKPVDPDYDHFLDDVTPSESGYPNTILRRETKVGRNDPCPCGSGKKFKKCCYGKPD